MTLTYTWKLKSLKKTNTSDLSDVVIGTRWELTGTDEDGISGTFYGATPFSLNKVDPNNFTPYEQLTQEQVLDWIKGFVTDKYKEHVESQIQKQIDAIKNPSNEVEDRSFPWDGPITQ